jgi:hypothetical protein
VRAIASAIPTMPELLDRAGFKIRGPKRATCVHCSGRDRTTVAYTDEVAYCHRCGWRANKITLARGLGLLSNDPATRARLHRERVERERREAKSRPFEAWRGNCQRMLTDRFRRLGQKAELARQVLARFPECEPAWEALARFYHGEAELSAALELLSFEKCSVWIEQPMRKETLAAAFEDARTRSGEGGYYARS